MHIQRIHNKSYKCNACDKIYGQAYKLEEHKRAAHLGLRPYICSMCQQSYPTKDHLNSHKRKAHNKTKPYQCSKCAKTFTTTARLGSKYVFSIIYSIICYNH